MRARVCASFMASSLLLFGFAPSFARILRDGTRRRAGTFQSRCRLNRNAHNRRVKYWEVIADNLSKAGWSWGYVSAFDSEGRTMWIVDGLRVTMSPGISSNEMPSSLSKCSLR